MQTRTRDRLKALEAKIAPKVQAPVFFCVDAVERGYPPRDEQLAAFRAEHGIGPSDPIHEVIITFC